MTNTAPPEQDSASGSGSDEDPLAAEDGDAVAAAAAADDHDHDDCHLQHNQAEDECSTINERTSLLMRPRRPAGSKSVASSSAAAAISTEEQGEDEQRSSSAASGGRQPNLLSSEVIRRTSVLLQLPSTISFSSDAISTHYSDLYLEEEDEDGVVMEAEEDEEEEEVSAAAVSSPSETKSNAAATASAAAGNGTGIGAVTFSSILNLVVSTAGGIGMVTLPGSLAQVGWFEGGMLLLACSVLAALSLVLLNAAANYLRDDASRTCSYAGLVAHALGERGSQTLELLTFLFCMGQVISLLGAIGGQISLLSNYWLGSSLSVHTSIAGAAFLAMLPMSLLPEQGALRFAGALGTACMMYIVGAVVVGDGSAVMRTGPCSLTAAKAGAGNDNDISVSPMAFNSSWATTLRNAPIFLFCMNAATAYVPVRYQHKNSLFDRLQSQSQQYLLEPAVEKESIKLIVVSILMAGSSYLACSGVAYAAYCASVPENVVDAWPMSWMPGLLARVFLSVELTVTGAGIYVPLGRAAYWHLRYGPFETVAATGWTRLFVTAVFIAAGSICSIALDGALALPLAVTSALCVSAQMLVLPGLCISRLSSSSVVPLITGGYLMAFAFVGLGGAFAALSLAALFGFL